MMQQHCSARFAQSRTRTLVICLTLCGLAACSSSSSGSRSITSLPAVRTSAPAPTATTVSRPPGATADLSTQLSGGNGVIMGEAVKPDLKAIGYVQSEYLATGTAIAYKVAGALAHDGRWTFVANSHAPYRTRVLVRAPARASAFSGTVIVEWLNVSGGVDADPEWSSTQEEIVRAGDVWVGVSAQLIGVECGPVLMKVPDAIPGAEMQGKGMNKVDPARYGGCTTLAMSTRPTSTRKLPVPSEVARD